MHFYSGITILGSEISNSNNILSSVCLLLIKLVKLIIESKLLVQKSQEIQHIYNQTDNSSHFSSSVSPAFRKTER